MSWRLKYRVELAGLERPGPPIAITGHRDLKRRLQWAAGYKFFKFCLPSEISSGSALPLG
jgi:hypothetical protein